MRGTTIPVFGGRLRKPHMLHDVHNNMECCRQKLEVTAQSVGAKVNGMFSERRKRGKRGEWRGSLRDLRTMF